MSDADTLTAPDGVSLPDSFPMAWIAHTCLCVMLKTLLVRDQTTTHSLAMFRQALTEWEIDL